MIAYIFQNIWGQFLHFVDQILRQNPDENCNNYEVGKSKILLLLSILNF